MTCAVNCDDDLQCIALKDDVIWPHSGTVWGPTNKDNLSNILVRHIMPNNLDNVEVFVLRETSVWVLKGAENSNLS